MVGESSKSEEESEEEEMSSPDKEDEFFIATIYGGNEEELEELPGKSDKSTFSMVGIAEDVIVKLGELTIPADFHVNKTSPSYKGSNPQVLLGPLFLGEDWLYELLAKMVGESSKSEKESEEEEMSSPYKEDEFFIATIYGGNEEELEELPGKCTDLGPCFVTCKIRKKYVPECLCNPGACASVMNPFIRPIKAHFLCSRLPRVTRCRWYNPTVTRTSCALAKYGAFDLCPELTSSIGSPLSPGQTCCHQVPKHLCHAAVANLIRSWNYHYASRGVGRMDLRV
ncbi:hypothetical protein PIB30_023311 [Stylosanthes scabra]|uniref:Uncharacterized protein n=1 Tax=Stylosanthes scabra TaxID=79078 RepID=A0ABU6R9P5_9FABA|nr:hypothetical protein [Stylosanthes scabra]